MVSFKPQLLCLGESLSCTHWIGQGLLMIRMRFCSLLCLSRWFWFPFTTAADLLYSASQMAYKTIYLGIIFLSGQTYPISWRTLVSVYEILIITKLGACCKVAVNHSPWLAPLAVQFIVSYHEMRHIMKLAKFSFYNQIQNTSKCFSNRLMDPSDECNLCYIHFLYTATLCVQKFS